MLARRGASVVVLEREPRAGGRLRTHTTADGFTLDCGAFLWPNRYLDRAFDAAGAHDFSAFTLPPDEVMRVFVAGGGGRPFVFPWPGLPESPPVLEALEAVYGSVERGRTLAPVWKTLAALSDADVEAHMHLSVESWLARHVRDAEVAAAMRRAVMLLGSLAPAEASVGELARLIRRRTPEGDPARPQVCGHNAIGGLAALVESLTGACRRAGVDLRLGAPALQLLVAGGRVAGVRYASEPCAIETLHGGSVVCNVPAWSLFTLVPERCFPADFVRNARHFARVGESVNVALACRGLPRLRATGAEDGFRGWSRLLVGPEREFGGGMMWTTLAAPQNAPAGCHLLHVTRHVPRGTIRDAERVGDMLGAIDAILRETYADLDERLLWRREWLTPESTEYMISTVPRPPLRVPGVDDLYLVGETVAAGALQMDNAARSALEVAAMIRSPA
jgi:phytoene dehydrogenase-like protein